nr:Major facilitator superfamily domain containing protein [Ipomoea trifida]
MIGSSEDDDTWTKPVGRCSVVFYGVGHMLNDITSACWFTYLLVFLTDIGLSPSNAAAVMLSGQIADGLTTIFAGELIDRFGHFKIWHAAGSLLVAVSFSSVFGGCLPCKIFGSNSSLLETIGYSMFAAIFNVGWAATQVANLSLYGVAFIVFNMKASGSIDAVENQVPAIIYVSSFVVSVMLQELTWTSQRIKAFYSVGGILWIFCGIVILLLPRNMNVFMYILSVVIGIANALIMVTGVSMQSVLVGEDLNGCAFVYGSLSFLDKISCGVALFILESYEENISRFTEDNIDVPFTFIADSTPALGDCSPFYAGFSITRYALGLVPAVCALIGVIVTCSMKLHTRTLKPLTEPLLA